MLSTHTVERPTLRPIKRRIITHVMSSLFALHPAAQPLRIDTMEHASAALLLRRFTSAKGADDIPAV